MSGSVVTYSAVAGQGFDLGGWGGGGWAWTLSSGGGRRIPGPMIFYAQNVKFSLPFFVDRFARDSF